jgi:O-antigen/teichoic acid export membrane protein
VIAPFEILPWVLLPIFLDFPVGSLLNATHRAHLKTSAMIATMFVNVLLNVLLVPLQGPVGAAWAGVFSFWFLFLVGAMFSAKDIGGWLAYVSIISRSLLAAAGAWIAWRMIGDAMPFYAACMFGGACALLLAFIFRLITLKDFAFIMKLRGLSPAEENIHENT